MREKLFRLTGDELPYTSTVIIDKYEEEGALRRIAATIIADVIIGGSEIKKVFARFKREGQGVFIYLRDGAAGVPARLGAEHGAEPADSEALRTQAWRDVGLGAQILRDLGVSSIRLRTSTPRTYVGLSGFGIEIKSCEPPF